MAAETATTTDLIECWCNLGAPSPSIVAAVHESAHAVVAIVLGLRVEYVTLKPPRCRVPETSDYLALAVQALAGEAAERIILNIVDPVAYRMDHVNARICLLKRTKTPVLSLEEAQARAASMVELHRSAIVRVAQALERVGRLTGDEVRLLSGTV